MSSQRNQSDSFRFKRAAFYQSLKSKVGLAAAKATALRMNLNVEGCNIVAAPVHAPSRAPLLLPPLLSHNLPTNPRGLAGCAEGQCVHGAREDELLARRLKGLSAGPGDEGGVMTEECGDVHGPVCLGSWSGNNGRLGAGTSTTHPSPPGCAQPRGAPPAAWRGQAGGGGGIVPAPSTPTKATLPNHSRGPLR